MKVDRRKGPRPKDPELVKRDAAIVEEAKDPTATLDAIGKRHDITRERVRQILSKAGVKGRGSSRARWIAKAVRRVAAGETLDEILPGGGKWRRSRAETQRMVMRAARSRGVEVADHQRPVAWRRARIIVRAAIAWNRGFTMRGKREAARSIAARVGVSRRDLFAWRGRYPHLFADRGKEMCGRWDSRRDLSPETLAKLDAAIASGAPLKEAGKALGFDDVDIYTLRCQGRLSASVRG